ncbi:MAG TPA: CBS domain-containing protein [Xanthobacteraceae bacterium]|jgi:CBS domain-containing protein
MQAKDVMTTPVLSVEPNATILQAIRTMLQRRISGLPVIDKDGHLVGMVTEGDFLRRVETGTQRQRPRWLEFVIGPGRLADEYTRSHSRRVSEVMTSDPITVAEDAPLDDIVKLMEKRRIKRIPVVRRKQVVGIITRANLIQAIASAVPEPRTGASTDDAAIRVRLLAELEKQAWAPAAFINPIVKDGVVELWGTITDERERQAIRVATENIPGVKAVRDQLVWVEPTSGMVIE